MAVVNRNEFSADLGEVAEGAFIFSSRLRSCQRSIITNLTPHEHDRFS